MKIPEILRRTSSGNHKEAAIAAAEVPEQAETANLIQQTSPYFRAKEIIEAEIARYKTDGNGHELPKVIFKRQEDQNVVEFQANEAADFHFIISKLVTILGNMNIASYYPGHINLSRDRLRISLSQGIVGRSVSFSTNGDLKDQEIEAIVITYQLANQRPEGTETNYRQTLIDLGATIYDPEKAPGWDYLAGYEIQKQQVREAVINPFLHPEVYEQIAEGTRKVFESNRPRAVLFDGPPGTGKTTMAKMIAGQVNAPMIYVPIESIMTKWYGESERNLAKVFTAAGQFSNSMIFLDEIDSLATSREGNIHEATRRVLSVLLRKIDGMSPAEGTILIGATNRKQDLDSALLSRFDTCIYFPLPNEEERKAIFENYARHLDEEDLVALATRSATLSGRGIRNLCERTERKWASEQITNQISSGLPAAGQYLELLESKEIEIL